MTTTWPLAAGLLLPAALTVWIPALNGINLRGMLLFVSDASWLLLINAVLAVLLVAWKTFTQTRRSSC